MQGLRSVIGDIGYDFFGFGENTPGGGFFHAREHRIPLCYYFGRPEIGTQAEESGLGLGNGGVGIEDVEEATWHIVAQDIRALCS